MTDPDDADIYSLKKEKLRAYEASLGGFELKAFEALEREFQEVLQELQQDRSLDRFRGEYEKLHRALKKSHEEKEEEEEREKEARDASTNKAGGQKLKGVYKQKVCHTSPQSLVTLEGTGIVVEEEADSIQEVSLKSAGRKTLWH